MLKEKRSAEGKKMGTVKANIVYYLENIPGLTIN